MPVMRRAGTAKALGAEHDGDGCKPPSGFRRQRTERARTRRPLHPYPWPQLRLRAVERDGTANSIQATTLDVEPLSRAAGASIYWLSPRFDTFNANRRLNWSGRRDSNPRPQPWQGCALPLSYARAPFPSGISPAGRRASYKLEIPLQWIDRWSDLVDFEIAPNSAGDGILGEPEGPRKRNLKPKASTDNRRRR